MSTGGCGGYRWSQGQYRMTDCNQESGTFFIILGFTMLVLLLMLFLIIVIACLKRRGLRRSQRNIPMSSLGSEDDCVLYIDGTEQTGASSGGRNLDAVKCVIMAGEDKPTFIAHPFPSESLSSVDSGQEEELTLSSDDEELNLGDISRLPISIRVQEQELNLGESSKQTQQEGT